MMKKFWVITVLAAMGIAVAGCNGVQRDPGRVYMPDMYYSRAYETYASTEGLKNEHVNYNALPVKGTIARGDLFPYELNNDSTGYVQSAAIKNPLDPATINMQEAQRLFLVNCGICHGPKLDGNGPLFKGGDGPYPVKPATLVGDAKYEAMPEGQMFQSVTYGKNMMGSYASQLSTRQRWMVIAYIKALQAVSKAKSDSTGKNSKDSSAVKAKK